MNSLKHTLKNVRTQIDHLVEIDFRICLDETDKTYKAILRTIKGAYEKLIMMKLLQMIFWNIYNTFKH